MQWTSVRLELGSTPSFPKGSAARAYIAHLPLSDGANVNDSLTQRSEELRQANQLLQNELGERERGRTVTTVGDRDDETEAEIAMMLRLFQSATVTRRKVAGMEAASLLGLLFWLLNKSSSCFCNSAARPCFSAASNAFIVGP